MSTHHKPRNPSKDEVEERKGLLAEEDRDYDEELPIAGGSGEEPQSSSWSPKKVVWIAAGFIALLICGTFAKTLLLTGRTPYFVEGQGTESNGTHEFKRTVLIVSIDGLRADYLDRGLTPHLLDISKKGLRAKSMKPIFPTLTFPNHWALMTGLYAESHGIVANNFWDPVTETEFHYNQVKSCWNPDWWYGEPMWETAEKAGIKTANLMWPGPPKTRTGWNSTYFIPWADKVPMKTKLNQIMSWIDLPLEDRPQLIMAYEPSLDQAGHLTGPNSALVNKTLSEVDVFAKDLHMSLVERNLSSIVDIVFVSDHGMTDTSNPEMIFLEDIIGDTGVAEIDHIDGWPSMGLRFNPAANASNYVRLLEEKADEDDGRKFEVYIRDENMPERYHFKKSERIAPVYVVPKIGYALTVKGEEGYMSLGNHGYDNENLEMHAMFVAHGPFSAVAKAASRPNKGWHSASEDIYVMERFQNVEIYNLVMKLLGVPLNMWAPNNGTRGFWDAYM